MHHRKGDPTTMSTMYAHHAAQAAAGARPCSRDRQVCPVRVAPTTFPSFTAPMGLLALGNEMNDYGMTIGSGSWVTTKRTTRHLGKHPT
jgi:hypothetical protein